MRGRRIHRRYIAAGPNLPGGKGWLRLDDRFDLLRLVATCLIAAALAMRASVPVGWMPNAADASHQAALIPCPMMDRTPMPMRDGMHGMAMPKQPAQPQRPAKHRLPPSHEGSICPFATAAQPIRTIEPHPTEIAPTRFAFFAPVASLVAATWDHVPRAPPHRAT
jgi:hypothetical protein